MPENHTEPFEGIEYPLTELLFEIDGRPHSMATQFLAAVPRRLLQREILSLESQAPVIVGALDCLFQGI